MKHRDRRGGIIRKFCLRAFVLSLSAALCLPLFASCKKDDPEVPEEGVLDSAFSVSGNNWTAEATHRDCTPVGDAVVLYTRAYQREGAPCAVVSVEHAEQPERTLICVGAEEASGGMTYSVLAVSAEDTQELPIPYNGFVLSVPKEKLGDARVRSGQKLTVTGAELLGELERRDGGTFLPTSAYGQALERRILYRDPVDGLQGEGVYFFSASYMADEKPKFPEECFVAVLEKASIGYRVETLSNLSYPVVERDQLVFYGAYETAYVKAFLAPEMKLTIDNLEAASPYSDVEALVIGDAVYRMPASAQNCGQITESGVYLTDASEGRLATPESTVDRIDLVVLNGKIAYIGEKNARSMLPLGGGVAVTFAGEQVRAAEGLQIGQEVETVLLDTSALPEQFVRIGDAVFAIDKIDMVRSPEGVTVLYTPTYGESTGANQYGLEIAIADGKVTDVKRDLGNMAIPENGYVLSIHKDSENYAPAAKYAKVGVDATVSIGQANYSISTLKVSAINDVRRENFLVVYRAQASTQTNEYGYEILVDADGRMIGESYFGNSAIPKDGLVLSAHGEAKDLLEGTYRHGAQVQFDEESMTVALFTSPETIFNDLAFRLDSSVELLADAKAKLLDLNYEAVEQTVEELTALSGKALQALRNGSYDEALSDAETLESQLQTLQYALIGTHAVENRAVWYRSNEKSDEQVLATINRMKALNINAVYLETWYNGRFTGISDNALIAHAVANGDYDALEGFVRIGHENGIEVHAWVENFFIGTVEAQEQANQPLAQHFEGRWLMDRKGKNTYFYSVSNTNFIFMNPFDREVRDFLLDFYREIVTKYDVDGIHLDYIRFPELNYGTDDFGYNEDIVSAWQKQENTTTDPRTLSSGALYNSWVLFRQEIINSFVGEVSEMLHRTKPSVWLSAAVYPRVDTYKNMIFQDCQNWVENGYMDELFSMSYGADNRYVSENADMFAGMTGDDCFYSTGISAFGDTTPGNFALQMTETTAAGADGVAIFALANIAPNYTSPVQMGAFRTPAVQATYLNETVAAQLESILRRTDSVYRPYAEISDEQCETIRTLLTPILDAANAFDRENASLSARSAYCGETLQAIAEAKETILPFFAKKTQRDTVRAEFENLERWLTVSQKRLDARG